MAQKTIFNRKNIIITGGAGFIGSFLCDELIKEANIICIDNFSTGDEGNIDHLLADPNFVFIRHDITNPIELENYPELQKFKIEFQGIQEIYNLACPMSPLNFKDNIIPTVLANSCGMKNVLDLAVKYNSKFLQFSSSVIYGPRKKDDAYFKEDYAGEVNDISERSSYDEGKRFAETITMNYRWQYGIDAKILRIFRIYGPRMKLNDGEMIPDFINNALDGKDLLIYGDNLFSSSFCYVSDCIDAAVKMMEADLSGPINIGSDILMNLTDVAKSIITKLNSKSKIVYTDKLLFMTPLGIPDISMARHDLGWMPIVTFNTGIDRTIYDLQAKKGLKGLREAIS